MRSVGIFVLLLLVLFTDLADSTEEVDSLWAFPTLPDAAAKLAELVLFTITPDITPGLEEALLDVSNCLLTTLKDSTISVLVDKALVSSSPVGCCSRSIKSICSAVMGEVFELEAQFAVDCLGGFSFVAHLGVDDMGEFTLDTLSAAEALEVEGSGKLRLDEHSRVERVDTLKCGVHSDTDGSVKFRLDERSKSDVEGLAKFRFGVHSDVDGSGKFWSVGITLSEVLALDKPKFDAHFDGESSGQFRCIVLSEVEDLDKSRSDVHLDAEGLSQFRSLTLSAVEGLDKSNFEAHFDGENVGQFRCCTVSEVKGLDKARSDSHFDVEGFIQVGPVALPEVEGLDKPRFDAHSDVEGLGSFRSVTLSEAEGLDNSRFDAHFDAAVLYKISLGKCSDVDIFARFTFMALSDFEGFSVSVFSFSLSSLLRMFAFNFLFISEFVLASFESPSCLAFSLPIGKNHSRSNFCTFFDVGETSDCFAGPFINSFIPFLTSTTVIWRSSSLSSFRVEPEGGDINAVESAAAAGEEVLNTEEEETSNCFAGPFITSFISFLTSATVIWRSSPLSSFKVDPEGGDVTAVEAAAAAGEEVLNTEEDKAAAQVDGVEVRMTWK